MTVARKLTKYLKQNKIKFETISHPESFTAQQTAQAERAPGKTMAKVVMVKADDKDVMAVLPATHRLNEQRFKKLLGVKKMRLSTEEEFEKLFDDCEVGAMPPFGNIYDVPFYVDQTLAQNDNIVFNAGTHRESVKIAFRDYERLVDPELCSFAVKTA